jgi:hypothetical protein
MIASETTKGAQLPWIIFNVIGADRSRVINSQIACSDHGSIEGRRLSIDWLGFCQRIYLPKSYSGTYACTLSIREGSLDRIHPWVRHN